MRYFVQLVERDRNANKVKIYFIQRNNNEAAIKKLREQMHIADLLNASLAYSFDFKDQWISERDVDALVKYSISDPHYEIHKLPGLLKLVPNDVRSTLSKFNIDSLIERPTDAFGNVLKKGDLVMYFAHHHQVHRRIGRVHNPETFTVTAFRTYRQTKNNHFGIPGDEYEVKAHEECARRLGRKFERTIKISVNQITDPVIKKFAESL